MHCENTSLLIEYQLDRITDSQQYILIDFINNTLLSRNKTSLLRNGIKNRIIFIKVFKTYFLLNYVSIYTIPIEIYHE